MSFKSSQKNDKSQSLYRLGPEGDDGAGRVWFVVGILPQRQLELDWKSGILTPGILNSGLARHQISIISKKNLTCIYWHSQKFLLRFINLEHQTSTKYIVQTVQQTCF